MSEDILSELQLLTSMYEPSDIHFDDPEISLKIENSIPISGSVSLKLKLSDYLEISIMIPTGYPSLERLSAHIRLLKNDTLAEYEAEINHDLSLLTKYELNGDPCDILMLITWCNDRWGTIQKDLEELEKSADDDLQNAASFASLSQGTEASQNLCRIWIHSHHIYNEKKRKFITETASNLDLSGFSLPGKPGFICVEGDPKSCDEFWTQVRQLTWQKISLIERQLFNENERAFSCNHFEELLIDKSSFMKYLNEKNISSVIKDYLGF